MDRLDTSGGVAKMVPATVYYRVVVFGGVSVGRNTASHWDTATLLNTLKYH